VQIIYEVEITLIEYYRKGTENCYPVIEVCPSCFSRQPLLRHGFYWRYALLLKRSYLLPILRLKCPCCEQTFSLLPDFLLPFYQTPVKLILEYLKRYWHDRRTAVYYQRLQFYRRRFLKNLNLMEAFFRELGHRDIIPRMLKGKAIKLLDMVNAFPKAETFARRYHDHFQQSFMAI